MCLHNILGTFSSPIPLGRFSLKLFLSKNLGDFKGTAFQKNQMGGYILAYRMNSLQIKIFENLLIF
jgi:hypothetical protein